MPRSPHSPACRSLVSAFMALLGAGCDNPLASANTSANANEVKVVVYEKLAELQAWDQAIAYCLSDGEGTSPVDPAQAVLDRLAANPAPFVPVSACGLLDGRLIVSGQTGFGQLFHIERVDIQGDQASVSAFYQRRADVAGGYDCELKRSGGVWTIQTCVPSARNDEIDIHMALYQGLGGYISFPSSAGAYCLSRGPLTEPADPAGVTLFRMIRSSDVKHFPASQCSMDGVPFAPGNTEAIGLHIERVEVEGDRAIADASVRYKQTVIDLQCEVGKVNQRFSSSKCWPAAQPELTDDDFAIRAALYKYLAVPIPPFLDLEAWCVSERYVDATQSGLVDPPPAVMSRLAGDSREFLPTSSCTRVSVPGSVSSAYHTPSDELAGWVHIDQIVRQPDYAEARITETHPYGGFLWHCVVEPVSEAWVVKSCEYFAFVD